MRTLQWRSDAPLWLDVERFERELAGGLLEQAVETYARELLEGRYDEWVFVRVRLAHTLWLPGDEVDAELEHALAVARRQGARALQQRVRGTLEERRLGHDRPS